MWKERLNMLITGEIEVVKDGMRSHEKEKWGMTEEMVPQESKMSVTGGLFEKGMTLRTHVACRRPSEAFQDDPRSLPIEELEVLEGRSGGILKRLCARESAGEIDSRWCVRPALGEAWGRKGKSSMGMTRYL
jgi:hypothetical protein